MVGPDRFGAGASRRFERIAFDDDQVDIEARPVVFQPPGAERGGLLGSGVAGDGLDHAVDELAHCHGSGPARRRRAPMPLAEAHGNANTTSVSVAATATYWRPSEPR